MMELKNIFFALFLGLSFSFLIAQQLENGTYFYTNAKGVVCTINSSNDGWNVEINLNLGKNYSGKIINANGEVLI